MKELERCPCGGEFKVKDIFEGETIAVWFVECIKCKTIRMAPGRSWAAARESFNRTMREERNHERSFPDQVSRTNP